MESVLQTLKRHGYSSLEELARAASHGGHQDDVACYTPAHSPKSLEAAKSDRRPEILSSSDRTYLNDGDQFLSIRLPSSSNDASSPARNSELVTLLSLSPVPRSPSPPTSLLLPERMLSTLKFYLQASFNAQIWTTSLNGHFTSVKDPRPLMRLDVEGNFSSAMKLIKKKKYVQARQLLSKAFTMMEHHIRFERPGTIPHLLCLCLNSHNCGSPAVAALMLRHSSQFATQILGDSHPLSLLWRYLPELTSPPPDLLSRLLQCNFDMLEKQVGTWHRGTQSALQTLIKSLSGSEAVQRSRVCLTMCETTYTKGDKSWQLSMVVLGWTLYRNQQYEEAESVARYETRTQT